jgi:uncharacterized protein YndB with AHSA1/START domain
MAHAKHEVVIDRPIDDIFSYLSNGENNARWRGRILEVERTSADDGQSATYRQVIHGPNGRRIRHDYRVTVHEPPIRLHFEHTAGLARPVGRFELTALGTARTTVSFELVWPAKGIKRVLNNMIESWMVSEVARLDNLKQLFEQA